jgi:hypothetical protein
MKEFYREMSGSQPVNTEWTDTLGAIRRDGARFALHAIPPEHARNIEISSPPKERETSPVKLIFAVDNVPAERERLEEMGITCCSDRGRTPPRSAKRVSARLSATSSPASVHNAARPIQSSKTCILSA